MINKRENTIILTFLTEVMTAIIQRSFTEKPIKSIVYQKTYVALWMEEYMAWPKRRES